MYSSPYNAVFTKTNMLTHTQTKNWSCCTVYSDMHRHSGGQVLNKKMAALLNVEKVKLHTIVQFFLYILGISILFYYLYTHGDI